MIVWSQYRGAVLALLAATAASWGTAPLTTAFLPSVTTRNAPARGSVFLADELRHKPNYLSHKRPFASLSPLRMASEDWNEAKYTEAAWACMSALTKVADYYSAARVESPFLLDVLLNPNKHGAGESAESAKKVVDKVLQEAGVDVKQLRKELEAYLAKQAKLTGGSTQKSMSQGLEKVLDTSRITTGVLGVS
jgi:hypothetical protein